MIKLLHISDIHLDRPFKSRNGKVIQCLRKAMRTALQRAVSFCIEREVDVLLIAGDLFDGETVEPGTALFLKGELDRMKNHDIQVVYATGNHDCAQRIRNLAFFNWPENVHLALSPQHQVFELKCKSGECFKVVACGHDSPVEMGNAISLFPTKGSLNTQPVVSGHGPTPVIGVAHTWLTHQVVDGKERYMPCSTDDIRKLDYDYFALGHIHARTSYLDGRVGYAGSLQAVDRDETGLKGGIYIEIEQGALNTTFVPFSGLVFVKLNVAVDGASTLEELGELMIEALNEHALKSSIHLSETLCSLNLKGRSPLKYMLNHDKTIEVLKELILDRTGTVAVELDLSEVGSVVNAADYVGTDTFLGHLLRTLDTHSQLNQVVDEMMTELKLSSNFKDHDEAKSWVLDVLTNSAEDLTGRMIRHEEDFES